MVRRCLPASPQERAYALITSVDSLGTGCFLTVSVVLFIQVVGVTPTQIGTALAIGGVLSVLARVPLGRLADRCGHRGTLVGVHLARAAAFPGYLIVHGFAAFLLLSVLILVLDGWESPVRKVLLYAVARPAERVRIAAYNRSVYNLAFAIGSLLATAALLDRAGLYLVVLVNAGSFLLAAALALRLPRPTKPRQPPGRPLNSTRYAGAGFLLGWLFVCTSVLTVGLPLQVLRTFPHRQWLIGLGMAINTVLAVGLQVRLSRGTVELAGSTRAAVRGGLVLTSACLLCYLSAITGQNPAVAVLLAGVGLLSIGDLLASASAWGLSYQLRRHDLTAHNQSVWSMYLSLPQLLGPLLVAWALTGIGAAGWLVLAGGFGLVSALLGPVLRTVDGRLTEQRPIDGYYEERTG